MSDKDDGLLPIKYENGKLVILNQLLLPLTFQYEEVKNKQDTFDAIKLMKVRGAPLIGIE
jgi:methylthioribose-1-phosphate isomerase